MKMIGRRTLPSARAACSSRPPISGIFTSSTRQPVSSARYDSRNSRRGTERLDAVIGLLEHPAQRFPAPMSSSTINTVVGFSLILECSLGVGKGELESAAAIIVRTDPQASVHANG